MSWLVSYQISKSNRKRSLKQLQNLIKNFLKSFIINALNISFLKDIAVKLKQKIKSIYILIWSKNYKSHMELLLLKSKRNSHYVYISNLYSLVYNNKAKTNETKHLYINCLQCLKIRVVEKLCYKRIEFFITQKD